MKIAACLGVISAAGYLALAPAGSDVQREERPRAGGRYRHQPVGVAPAHRVFEADVEDRGGRSVAAPEEMAVPDTL
jgi:hypothetical protein